MEKLKELEETIKNKRTKLMQILDEQDKRKDLSYKKEEEKVLIREIIEIDKMIILKRNELKK